ncbi:MAG: hypothetical protein JSS36_04435 [Proteobacteria bacterium]|nr:hypothetical protein [Pseudomonadota bacterium]
MLFLITYDNHPPRNYDALYHLMNSWSAVRLAESVWLANLKGPAEAVRDFVQSTMQFNDTVAVIEIKPGSGWATSNVKPASNAWLAANIAPAQKAA